MRKSRLTSRSGRFVAAAALLLGASVVAASGAGASGGAAPVRPGHATVVAAADAAPAAAVAHAATTTAADPCGYVASVPADNFKGIPQFDAKKAAQPFSMVFHTSQGDITVKALTAAAPCTTNSFRFLIDHGYYNGTHCHRLTTQRLWVLQCGDPTGTGSGGPGYSFNDENLAGATYPAGTVAMANAGPNTNGSQFFFTWKDTKLRPDYTPFGVVTSGMDVLQKIAAAGEDDQNSAGDGYPNDYVLFHHVSIRPQW
jgi:peptidyl-prolyl cis-trans isomerase B (cyclophilin B)